MSQKKLCVADYWYFKNGTMQHCNNFRHNKWNLYLVVCDVSTQYVKCNWSYERKRNNWSNLAYDITTNLTTNIFNHPSIIWPTILLAFITSVTFDIQGRNLKQLDKSCIYYVSIYYRVMLHHFYDVVNLLHRTFLRYEME